MMYMVFCTVVYVLAWYDARTELRMRKRKQTELAKSMRKCEKRMKTAQKNLCYTIAEAERNEYQRLKEEYWVA